MRKKKCFPLFLSVLLCMGIGICVGQAEEKEAKNSSATQQTGLARVAVDFANVRTEPVDGEVIGVVMQDDVVYVFGEQEDPSGYTWYHVNAYIGYQDRKGWMRGDLLILPDTLFCDLVDFGITEHHILGLKKDGTVIGGGCQFYEPFEVEGIYNVRHIDVGWYTSFVFFQDGTYWAHGRSAQPTGEDDVKGLQSATVIGETWLGILEDGTVYMPYSSRSYEESEQQYVKILSLQNVRQIEEGFNFALCVTEDGKVTVGGIEREKYAGVENWDDIVKVSAQEHVIGLKRDGTVVAFGDNAYGECDVADWSDIVDIAAGEYFTIGLRSDGTVVATGSNETNACDVEHFRDIVQIEADHFYCAGRTSAGTLMFAGEFRFLEKSPLPTRIMMSSGE